MTEEERKRRIKQVNRFLLATGSPNWPMDDGASIEVWLALAAIALEAIDDREEHSHD